MTGALRLTKTAAAVELALDRAGVIAGRELRTLFGDGAVNRALASGDLVRMLPGVYCASAHAAAFHTRAQAASLWADAPVSGAAALYLWGLLDEPPAVVDVVVMHGRHPRPQEGVRIRQSTVGVPQTTRQGVRVVSPAAAVVLGYGAIPKSHRSEVFYAAIRRRIASPAQLEAVLDLVPRVKARRSLERSVRAAAAGAQSYLEEKALYEVFNTAEFAGFVRQHQVVIEGNQFFLDMFHPATKLALELDGRNGHLDEFRRKNITRDCWVATVGIQTLRFSYWDLVERPEWCRQVVRETMRVRVRQLATLRLAPMST
jgi:very-short-patch-repair endonuclease